MIFDYIPYERLVNGSYLEATAQSYDLAFGGIGLFYLILYMIVLIAIAVKTESPAAVFFFSVLGGFAMFMYMPESMRQWFYLITVLSGAITLYKLFMHKRGSEI